MQGAAQNERVAPLRISRLTPEALLTELRSELDHSRRSEKAGLRSHLEPNLPDLQTDRTKLVSIVRNLVNNAFKYSRRFPVFHFFS